MYMNTMGTLAYEVNNYCNINLYCLYFIVIFSSLHTLIFNVVSGGLWQLLVEPRRSVEEQHGSEVVQSAPSHKKKVLSWLVNSCIAEVIFPDKSWGINCGFSEFTRTC